MFAIPGFFAGIGPMEILVILVIALVLFGNRLPDVAKTLGKGYMEFRRGLKTLENSIDLDAEPRRENPRGPETPVALLPRDATKTPPAAGNAGIGTAAKDAGDKPDPGVPDGRG